MVRADRIAAIGEDHQQRQLLQAPAQISEEIQGGLVRPMNILDDQQCQSIAEHGAEPAEQVEPIRGSVMPILELPAEGVGDIVERPHRTRGQNPVTQPRSAL